jgi:hypothetical protein
MNYLIRKKVRASSFSFEEMMMGIPASKNIWTWQFAPFNLVPRTNEDLSRDDPE